jgi:hypothetical protein
MSLPGRQDSVVTGSYLASEFSGGNSAANLKDSISGSCPLLPFGSPPVPTAGTGETTASTPSATMPAARGGDPGALAVPVLTC